MFPAEPVGYRPRSMVTALVLIAIGFSCLWVSESSGRRARLAAAAHPVSIAPAR